MKERSHAPTHRQPFLGRHLLIRPGRGNGIKLPRPKYLELREATDCPEWLIQAVRRAWNIDLAGCTVPETILVRDQSAYGYARASYELNLGCNYDCEHCYLGLKKFDGLDWSARERLLEILRDAGVLWLQLTGGEPMIDRLFPEVYERAFDLGMVPTILSNGSMIVTKHNAHEVPQMRSLAERLGIPMDEYVNMVPTIYGGAESLPSQSAEHLRKRRVFAGCHAGHTFFHVDPHGNASICKVGREPNIPLIDEGLEGLRRLGGIADRLLVRQGGCTGCTLQSTCGTCMPLVQLYRKAKAPLATYCQHREGKEEAE